jgi:hypothetical protein
MSWLKEVYRFLNPKFQNAFLDYQVELKPRYGDIGHDLLNNIISQHDRDYISLLNDALNYKSVFQSIADSKSEKNPLAPSWNNGFFPGLDVIILYTIIAKFKPSRYIEVGSGNSTKVVHKSRVDNSTYTKIISIDPMPRAEIDKISDEIIRMPFEKIDLSIFNSLNENDIVFIDNSHRIFANSDANVFFMDVLPYLKKGTIVHVHDVYLPYDYPQNMCDRYYNEQYGLAYYLLANPHRYKVLFPCFYVSQQKHLSSVIGELWEHEVLKNVERHGGSFYIQIG